MERPAAKLLSMESILLGYYETRIHSGEPPKCVDCSKTIKMGFPAIGTPAGYLCISCSKKRGLDNPLHHFNT